MRSFQVSGQGEVALFHGPHGVLIGYHPNFSVGLCKGHLCAGCALLQAAKSLASNRGVWVQFQR